MSSLSSSTGRSQHLRRQLHPALLRDRCLGGSRIAVFPASSRSSPRSTDSQHPLGPRYAHHRKRRASDNFLAGAYQKRTADILSPPQRRARESPRRGKNQLAPGYARGQMRLRLRSIHITAGAQPKGNSEPFKGFNTSFRLGSMIMKATGSPSNSATRIRSSKTIDLSFLPA